MSILIDPSRIRAFGHSPDTHFYVITNPSLMDQIGVKNTPHYLSHRVIAHDKERPFNDLLAREIQPRAHVLVISPDVFFQSPAQELIGPQRKLLAMACNSTPTDIDTIRHFLGSICKCNTPG